eukprot:8276614-Lingulodinium_polyedra.AAC.1
MTFGPLPRAGQNRKRPSLPSHNNAKHEAHLAGKRMSPAVFTCIDRGLTKNGQRVDVASLFVQ